MFLSLGAGEDDAPAPMAPASTSILPSGAGEVDFPALWRGRAWLLPSGAGEQDFLLLRDGEHDDFLAPSSVGEHDFPARLRLL